MAVISYPAQLQAMPLTGSHTLANDIDMAGYSFTPIGDSTTSSRRFSGTFDGKGFKIKNLTISSPNQFVGLFGYVSSGGIIRNVVLENVTITGTGTNANVGGLVGYLIGQVSNVYVSGSVHCPNGSRIGGIAGIIASAGNVYDSYATTHITGGSLNAGGITSRIEKIEQTLGAIKNSYFMGTIDSNATEIGGCVGGALGTAGFKIPGYYYNSDLLRDVAINKEYDYPLTTAQMKEKANFDGYSELTWTFEEGKFPYLNSLGEQPIEEPPAPAQKETFTVSSHTEPIVSFLTKSRRKVMTTSSFTLPLAQEIQKKLLTNCVSIVDEITSSVVAIKNANIKTHVVHSYLQELSGYSESVARTIRSVSSYIDPVASYVEIRLPEKIYEPVYAIAHFVVNPSMANMEFNKSVIEILNNKTTADNLTGESVISYEENRTNTEVI